MKVCAQCGNQNPDDVVFCANCGNPLGQAPQQAQTSQVQAPQQMPTGMVQQTMPQQPMQAPQAVPQAASQPAPQMMPTGQVPMQPAQPMPAAQPMQQAMPTGQIPQGVPQPTAPIAPVAPVAPAAATAKINKGLVGGIAIAVVVVLVAIITVTKVVGNMGDPSKVVNDYVTALSEGRYGDAISMEGSSLSDAQKALLTNSVVQDANDRISNVDVSPTGKTSGATRSFKVDYTFNDQSQSATVVLKKDGKKGLVDKWKFEKSMLSDIFISYPSSITPNITVNGVTVGADNSSYDPKDIDLSSVLDSSSGRSFYRFAVYPGGYDVSFPNDSKYINVVAESSSDGLSKEYVNVPGPRGEGESDGSYVDPRGLQLYQAPTNQLVTDINAQLKTFYDSCIRTASSNTKPDDSCSIQWDSSNTDSKYSNWKYTVKTEPEIDASDISFKIASDGTVTGSATARADYNYSYTYNDSWFGPEDKSRTGSSTLDVTFTIKGDDLTVKIS